MVCNRLFLTPIIGDISCNYILDTSVVLSLYSLLCIEIETIIFLVKSSFFRNLCLCTNLIDLFLEEK